MRKYLRVVKAPVPEFRDVDDLILDPGEQIETVLETRDGELYIFVSHQ